MHANLGALIGWTSQDLGNRVALKLEVVTKPGPHQLDDIDTQLIVIDKTQAIQLGSYLFRITGQSEPKRTPKGLLNRLFSF